MLNGPFDIEVGEESLTKEPSVIEDVAYRDTWGRGADSFIAMIYERLILMRDLLAQDGSIYVHLDEKMVHYVKAILDEIFPSTFRNDLIVRSTFSHADAHQFGSVHQNILFYSRSENYNFKAVYIPYEQDSKIILINITGIVIQTAVNGCHAS